MDDFIKFSEFQKMVNFTPIKTWRLFDRLRKTNTLKEGVDWKSESGELFVVPTRLFVEAKNLRPELAYVKSSDFKMKSDEISEKPRENQKKVSSKKKISDKVISNEIKMKSSEIARNQAVSSQIVDLLKSQIKTLKIDKRYLREQLKEKTDEVKNLNRERAYLMQDWRKAIGENDDLRKLLAGGKTGNETNKQGSDELEKSKSKVQESEPIIVGQESDEAEAVDEVDELETSPAASSTGEEDHDDNERENEAEHDEVQDQATRRTDIPNDDRPESEKVETGAVEIAKKPTILKVKNSNSETLSERAQTADSGKSGGKGEVQNPMRREKQPLDEKFETKMKNDTAQQKTPRKKGIFGWIMS